MALKFLNKKGWHTGSLRNIENVWKAEQKHEAEQRKLEELRKQILEERERDEFRHLQEQAGLTPRQERLEFLYDSGLAVGRSSSSEGFQALQAPAPPSTPASASASAPDSSKSSVPGALFEDKPQSANDAWRKLHSDPLLMIRQREQEALARIKNNPVKMAMIRKSMETKKKDGQAPDGERQKRKSKHQKHSSSKYHSDSDNYNHEEKEKRKEAKHKKRELLDSDEDSRQRKHSHSDSDNDSYEEKERRRKEKYRKREYQDSDEDTRDRTRPRKHSHREYESEKQRHSSPSKQKADKTEESLRESSKHKRDSHKDLDNEKRRDSSPSKQKGDGREDREQSKRSYDKSKNEDYKARDKGSSHQASDSNYSAVPPKPDLNKRRGRASQLSEEERAARLREMQMDAELHEKQRWKRLRKADEDDAQEASQSNASKGRSFLDAVQKSVYGAEKGGSSTIEESVRRRSHFLQGRTEADERNAFRR